MNNKITSKQIIEALNSKNIAYEKLFLTDEVFIIITKLGGRIFGPFLSDDSESLFWVNSAFKNPDIFNNTFIINREWNLGGDRLWIAPEFPFFNKERKKFMETYTVQAEIDPGNYSLNKYFDKIILEQYVDINVFEMDFENKKFYMKRSINKATDPLKKKIDSEQYFNELAYFGFNQEIYLKDNSPEKEMYLESWDLTQINPGGKIILPYQGDFEFINYYEVVSEKVQKIHNKYIELDIMPGKVCKVGYPSCILTGRSGYVNKLDNEKYYIFIKNYFNNPSSVYCCEPWDQPGKNGCSMFVYIDSGNLGGFAEFENSGLTFSGDTQRIESQDTINYWFYVGEKRQIEMIIGLLLGVDYKID